MNSLHTCERYQRRTIANVVWKAAFSKCNPSRREVSLAVLTASLARDTRHVHQNKYLLDPIFLTNCGGKSPTNGLGMNCNGASHTQCFVH